jgi:ATP-binding cassette subfamily B protein
LLRQPLAGAVSLVVVAAYIAVNLVVTTAMSGPPT